MFSGRQPIGAELVEPGEDSNQAGALPTPAPSWLDPSSSP